MATPNNYSDIGASNGNTIINSSGGGGSHTSGGGSTSSISGSSGSSSGGGSTAPIGASSSSGGGSASTQASTVQMDNNLNVIGSFDMTPFYVVGGIVLVAYSTILVLKWLVFNKYFSVKKSNGSFKMGPKNWNITK